MAAILRYCVAGPMKPYFTGSASLDLAYVAPNLIVCSMPTSDYIKSFYRMCLDDLLTFLKAKHRDSWRIWNFQAEISGYNDFEVGHNIEHFGFPDHNPPPFGMLPKIAYSIEKYLASGGDKVAVLHCKQGKGRSGTAACAYLISAHNMSFEQATEEFTKSRMRPQFGQGISIYSQRRYLKYMHDYVHNLNRQYCPIEIQIDAIKIWRPVYSDLDVRLETHSPNGTAILPVHEFGLFEIGQRTPESMALVPCIPIFMPADVRISFQHGLKVGKSIPVVHSTAYVWFNAYFETYGCPEGFNFGVTKGTKLVHWKDLDGFKGTHTRGSALFERMEVSWSVTKGVPV